MRSHVAAATIAAAVALGLAGCAPAPPPATPAPAPRPDSTVVARRPAPARPPVRRAPDADSAARARRDAAARARRDSAAAVAARPERAPARAPAARPRGRAAAPGSRVPVPPAAAPRAAGEARICAGGDVTLGTNLDTTWVAVASRRAGEPVPPLPPPSSLLEPLVPLVEDAEVVLVNVEAAIGEGRATRKCPPGSTACFALRQPVSAAAALRALAPGRVVVGTLANNHARDAGEDGFVRTSEHLVEAGVLVTGADTLATPIAVNGDTIALLGFATSPRGPDVRDLAAVRRHVQRAVERYGRVVVTMHMGAEGVRAQRTRSQREQYFGENRGNPVAFARTAVAAGASLVIGHGPHVMRAAEWRGSRLIAYSLGNLVTHGPFLMNEPLNRGAVLCATLGRDGAVRDAVLQPTWQRRVGIVGFDRSARALVLVDSLSRLDFPRTGARVDADGRVLRP